MAIGTDREISFTLVVHVVADGSKVFVEYFLLGGSRIVLSQDVVE